MQNRRHHQTKMNSEYNYTARDIAEQKTQNKE